MGAAERELSWRVSPIDNKGARVILPDPLLAADMGLTTDEYEWLIALLGEALRGVIQYPQAVEKLIDDFPLMFIAGLTGSALLNTSDSFWEDFRRRIGIPDSSRLESLIRRDLHRLLQRKKLATFSTADLSGRDYVGAIELHSMLPNRYLSSVLSFLDELHCRNVGFSSAEDCGRYAVSEFSHQARELGVPAAVHNLATHIPDRASDVFSRIEEIRAYFADPDTDPAEVEFQDTNGLPEPMFSHLVSLITADETPPGETPTPSDSTATLEEPYLSLNLEEMELRIVFPAIPRGLFQEGDLPPWRVHLDDEIVSVTSEYDWSTGGFERTSLFVERPFSRLAVFLPDGSAGKLVLEMDRQVPALFFREDGGLRANQEKLGLQDSLVLAQTSTVLDASTTAGTAFAPEDLGPVRGWQGWSLRRVPSDGLRALTVKHGAHRRHLLVDRKVEAQWVDTGATIPYLKGRDLQPVFHRSPQILIPSDQSIWSLEYLHVDSEGNRESFDYYKVEDDYRDDPFDVFDELDEPWVGRYEIIVRRGAQIHMRRVFNMAEGLSAKLSFEQAVRRGTFRVPHMPDKKPGLSKALVEFSAPARMRIRHPLGSQALGNQHRTRSFPITSASDPDLYCLDVQVDAPRLQYLLPVRDEPARWTDSPVTINADDLADNDEIQLKFPQRVLDVELSVVPFSRNRRSINPEVIRLSRKGSSNVWSCPTSRLTAAISTNSTFQVIASWHLLSVEDYVREVMDKYERRAWFKTPASRRPDPRTGKKAVALLFSVSRKPLVTDAELKEDSLYLRLGRDTDLPLVTWAWQLHDPAAAPVRINMTGTRGQLPAELVDAGPLIVDTREEEFLMMWDPEIPSARSLLVGESVLQPAHDPTNQHRWLFTRDRELLPSEVQTVWDIRDRMHNVLAQSRNRAHPTLAQLDMTTLEYLTASPRISLAELDNSAIPRERQLEAFIRSGLAVEDFSSFITAGDIHPTPWIGLIQEMNDLRVLQGVRADDPSTAAERAESEHYVRTVGGHELWRIFSGSSQGIPVVQQHVLSKTELALVRNQDVGRLRESLGFSAVGSAFISGDSRVAAQLTWMENRREFSSTSRLEELFQALQRWENLIDHLNDPELKKTARSLALIAEENHRATEDSWLFVPYISFVFSLLSRAIAHRIIRPVQELHELRHTWASCARHAPELAAFDLVAAEAAALNARS
ncbi:MAG: hypothetical protein GX859_00885 [Corynebacterium humireducens]|jgi:hypothetical protein|uniref:Uncharacterized protein n=1 Tax=Corynebacterium humireducens TaxID=1223514 RepID=A0A7X6SV74_9CORY|nr:hypothetical protein [Corynebacterium humireducens]